MRRSLAIVVVAGLALTLAAAPALAKGPHEAVVTGPGLPQPVTLTDEAGFIFFLSRPGGHALLGHRPYQPLGPRFTVKYPSIWGPGTHTVVEYIFPYAKPRPVSYTPPQQDGLPLFRRYSWEAARQGFAEQFLADIGLPPMRATPSPLTPASKATAPTPVTLVALVGVAAAVLVGIALLLQRRRGHPRRVLQA